MKPVIKVEKFTYQKAFMAMIFIGIDLIIRLESDSLRNLKKEIKARRCQIGYITAREDNRHFEYHPRLSVDQMIIQ